MDRGRVEDGSGVLARIVPWAALRYQHTVAIRARLQDRYAPATANKLLAALRRVLREARRLGQIGADDYDRATDLGSVRAERLPRGRLVTEAEVTALLRTCADAPSPERATGRSSPCCAAPGCVGPRPRRLTWRTMIRKTVGLPFREAKVGKIG